MVDVDRKPVTARTATARARVLMPASVVAAVESQTVKKGDVLTVAQIAGICAAKKTADLIPLCHNIPISAVDVSLNIWRGNNRTDDVNNNDNDSIYNDNNSINDHNNNNIRVARNNEDDSRSGVEVLATVTAEGKTGVEMEALTGVLVAALTVYDMCKALTKDIVITDACLLHKAGGKQPYRRRKESDDANVDENET